jgi:hypothetical protein
MNISDELNSDIMEIINTSIQEYASGRLFVSTNVINKIANLCGLNYLRMGKYKRSRFRIDIISSYQMKHFKLTIDYNI